MLTMVTLTGADDSVRPSELVEISKKHPFVEWGILMGTVSGVERFPSEKWVKQLTEEAANNKLQLSAHLCDDFLNSMFYSGSYPVNPEYANIFQRCQLNFHGELIPEQDRAAIIKTFTVNPKWQGEVIVQLDNVNNSILDELLTHNVQASGLYDTSHGFGIRPENWAKPNPKWKVGYAGGIGPRTILSDLYKIKEAAGEQDFWIDMENNLRTVPYAAPIDVFDLEKGISVLNAVAGEFPKNDIEDPKYFKWNV